MSFFRRPKHLVDGHLKMAKPYKAARRPWIKSSLIGLVVLLILVVAAVVGMGKRGLIGLMVGKNQLGPQRYLIISPVNDQKVRLGIAVWQDGEGSLSWLPTLETIEASNGGSLSDQKWFQKLGLLFGGVYQTGVGVVAEKDTDAKNLGQEIEGKLWQGWGMGAPERVQLARLWLITHAGTVTTAQASAGAQLRRELDLGPLLTSFNSNCPVMIINTTGYTGLANRYSQLLETEGLRVVRLDTSNEAMAKSKIWIDSAKAQSCLPAAQIISGLFSNQYADQNQVEKHDDLDAQYRASLVLFLGEDSTGLAE